MKTVIGILFVALIGITLGACSPKVGSKAWCAAMKEKPRGEWTTNEMGDFLKHCAFK